MDKNMQIQHISESIKKSKWSMEWFIQWLLLVHFWWHSWRWSDVKSEHFSIIIPRPTKLEGGYTGFTLSVRPSIRPSVRLSVCRRHGFRSISQVSFGISISNFISMLMVALGRSLLIFSDVTFKMAAWRPYWIFWFPDSNFTLALNINLNFSGTIHMYMGGSLLIFSNVIFKIAAWRPY